MAARVSEEYLEVVTEGTSKSRVSEIFIEVITNKPGNAGFYYSVSQGISGHN